MKKKTLILLTTSIMLTLGACKSNESAYKKAYENAKLQELAEQQEAVEPETPTEAEVTPVVTPEPAPTAPTVVERVPMEVHEEKVTVVSPNGGLDNYSVVCGSFIAQANADGLKSTLDADGYNALVVYNAEKNVYRVVVSTFPDRESAAAARDAFKARYPNNSDFQTAWLLYRID